MSYVQRQAAHCDQCSHEWLVAGASMPTHCAKCKSRRWNGGAVARPDRALAKEPEAVGSIPTAPIKPNMQDLRDICAGRVVTVPVLSADDPMSQFREIPICGKKWWEDGEQYECLMDKGHKEQKHGLRGMVRRLDA